MRFFSSISTVAYFTLFCLVSSSVFIGGVIVLLGYLGYPAPTGARLGPSRVWLVERGDHRALSSIDAQGIPEKTAAEAINTPGRLISLGGKKVLALPYDKGHTLIEIKRPIITSPEPYLMLLTIFEVLLLTALSMAGVILLYVRVISTKAERVFMAIERGDLDARFEVTRLDEVGQIGIQFNRMIDKVRELVGSIQSKERARTELLKDLAHDTRTPLTSVRYIVDQLIESPKKLGQRAGQERLRIVQREVTYFQRMIEDLFLLAELEHMKHTDKRVELLSLLEDEISHLRGLERARGKKLNIVVDVPPFLESHLHADPFLFGRLFRNILENAAFHARSEVQISVSAQDGWVTFAFRDDGKGFTPEQIEKFGTRRPSRFMDATSKDKISLGLGSVIVRSICEKFEGKLIVSNWPETGKTKGAQVAVSFPNPQYSTKEEYQAL